MLNVSESKSLLEKPEKPSAEVSAQETATAVLGAGGGLSEYQARMHGDLFSGMYFDDPDDQPEWGTYGLSRELPAGLSASEVEDFLVRGEHLELVKYLAADISSEQKANMAHIPGWRRKKVDAREKETAAAEMLTPTMPPVNEFAVRPDAGIVSAPLSVQGADALAPAPAGNLATMETESAGSAAGGGGIEQLKRIIASGNTGHAEASRLAAELHERASKTPTIL